MDAPSSDVPAALMSDTAVVTQDTTGTNPDVIEIEDTVVGRKRTQVCCVV
jgi:hypothetical protein